MYFGVVGALHAYVSFVQPWMYLNLGGGGQAIVGSIAGLLGAILLLVNDDRPRALAFARALVVAGVIVLLAGWAIGLFVAPAEQYMGNVQRIMYVHVPTAWNWMVAVLFTFGAAVVFLFKNDVKWDARVEAGLEVSSLLAFLLCIQGSIWAKPTWGVWWDWDPRLTSTAVFLFALLGINALRQFVDDPQRRAVWSAVATIIASVDLPIVYFSVKWWNSLHQQQSTPQTVSSPFHLPLRLNAFGILFLVIGFLMLRSRLAAHRLEREMAMPPMTEAGEIA
jgi:heme exporter protein C